MSATCYRVTDDAGDTAYIRCPRHGFPEAILVDDGTPLRRVVLTDPQTRAIVERYDSEAVELDRFDELDGELAQLNGGD